MNEISIERMTAAAARVGTWLAEQPVGPPARDWNEFAVTFDAIDTAATARLHADLDAVSPGAPWFTDTAPSHGAGWFVDVTDGAVQYLQGLPHWCVTLAYVVDRHAVATVIHSPTREQTYTATAGGGALCNGQPIRPSAKTDLGVCIAAMNHPPYVARQPKAITSAGKALSALLPVVGAVRNFGPTSWQIAETASGRIDLFYDYGHDEENLLAAALIAAEAGLDVVDVTGQPWSPDAATFLAVPPRLRADVVDLLSETVE